MVSGAKLNRTQRAMGALVPYADELEKITSHLVGGEGMPPVPLATPRMVQRATIVGFASNSTLCGTYNNNVVHRTEEALAQLTQQGAESVAVVAVGAKLADGITRGGKKCDSLHEELSNRPTYEQAAALARKFMEEYLAGNSDKVELVYYKFLSPGNQQLVCETLLPIEINGTDRDKWSGGVKYIIEPTRQELLAELVPKQVCLKLYAAALSASASEHAARMMAMQAATDNADTLVGELALEYNKQRQQAITTELLDIMGGQRGK